MYHKSTGLLAAWAYFVCLPVLAQDAGAPPARCASPEYRQFDFWIGNWAVLDPDGKVVGHNRIEVILNGCVLMENWTSTGTTTGHSFNIYDERSGRWHQTWVDSNGLLLELDGGLVDGAMVLDGNIVEGGVSVKQRITWTKNADGSVRQFWEMSKDNWTTSEVAFDGLYRKQSQ